MPAKRTSFLDRNPVFLPHLVWIFALIATLLVGVYQGLDANEILPITGAAMAPAVIGLVLGPVMHREWAQIVLILSWAALALLACITLGFVPMALLFLSLPAAAMLFYREKFLESLIIAALIGGIVFFALRLGYVTQTKLIEADLRQWTKLSGLAALLSFMLSAMFVAATRRSVPTKMLGSKTKTAWRDGVEGGLFEFNAQGDLIGSNEAGAAQFDGEAPASLFKFLPFDHVDQTALGELIKASEKNQTPQNLRFSHYTNGALASYDMRITPLDKGGWLVHTHDRTEDEAQLETHRRLGISAQRDSSDKTLFFAGVSHELRTPLNAIIGFSDMMRSRLFGPLPSKYAEYADLIHDSGQHMLDLIGDVLDLSKLEAGRYDLNYDTFDAADVIRSSVKMIQPAADAAEVAIDVNLDLDQALLIQADRRAVRQILLNLLSNAVKFSEKGTHVDVDAQAIDGDLELTVSDQGMGMTEEELAKIGAPYVQGEAGKLAVERGTGLGLSLVKSLTALHNGKIDIASKPGDGTRVKITLPLQAE